MHAAQSLTVFVDRQLLQTRECRWGMDMEDVEVGVKTCGLGAGGCEEVGGQAF